MPCRLNRLLLIVALFPLAACAAHGTFVHPFNSFAQFERDDLTCRRYGVSARDPGGEPSAIHARDNEAAILQDQELAYGDCMTHKGYAFAKYTPDEWAQVVKILRSNDDEAVKQARLRAWREAYYHRKVSGEDLH